MFTGFFCLTLHPLTFFGNDRRRKYKSLKLPKRRGRGHYMGEQEGEKTSLISPKTTTVV